MAGPTIDHIVSVVLLVAALLLSFTVYNQILANAIEYERHRQVAMKAMDIMDTICLSPGNPPDWGQSDSTPSGFGLQDPESAGYVLSAFSINRLFASGGGLVYYPKTGKWYNNISMGEGGCLMVPVADCINYTTVAELLGINVSYGFQLTIMPTVSVSVTQVNPNNPLRFKVEVRGPGLAIGGATLTYNLYHAIRRTGNYPQIEIFSGTTVTDSAGLAFLEFPSINGLGDTYSIIVYAHIGGLVGVGYNFHETMKTKEDIIPFIESFEEGIIILAHNYDVHYYGPPEHALFYNSTFFLLTEDFELRPVQIDNSAGKVVYGWGWPYGQVRIPPSQPGILLVIYRTGNEFGTVMMPWGISTLGVSITFGDDPSGNEWVATELRQVVVNEMSYQVKLAVWSLKD